jgi:hypothetical protein
VCTARWRTARLSLTASSGQTYRTTDQSSTRGECTGVAYMHDLRG